MIWLRPGRFNGRCLPGVRAKLGGGCGFSRQGYIASAAGLHGRKYPGMEAGVAGITTDGLTQEQDEHAFERSRPLGAMDVVILTGGALNHSALSHHNFGPSRGRHWISFPLTRRGSSDAGTWLQSYFTSKSSLCEARRDVVTPGDCRSDVTTAGSCGWAERSSENQTAGRNSMKFCSQSTHNYKSAYRRP